MPMPPKIVASIYRHDVVVEIKFAHFRQPDPAPRENCRFWSKKSRKRLMFVVLNTDVEFQSMVTLTYPAVFPKDGQVVKTHLDLMLKWLKYHTGKSNYLWFFEWQLRGAPHVHILLEASLRGLVTVSDVSAAWYRICGTEDPKHLAAGTRCESLRKKNGAVRYALKYASKMRQKRVPDDFINVGRMWAHSRDVAPKPRNQVGFENVKELKAALATWPHLADLDDHLFRNLYGAAEYFKFSHSEHDHEKSPKMAGGVPETRF